MSETIGWNAHDWSPLFSITKESCVPFTLDHFNFGGLVHGDTIKFWCPALEQDLVENFKVDAEIAERALLNSTNEAFQEKSNSAHDQDQVQSDRLSKEEEAVDRIVEPIEYELIKDGSVDLTAKTEQTPERNCE